jgi:hypothetical protein
LFEDRVFVQGVVTGEGRDLGEQPIGECPRNIRSPFELHAAEDACDLLSDVTSDDGGAFIVTDEGELSSILLERIELPLEFLGNRVLVDPFPQRRRQALRIARRAPEREKAPMPSDIPPIALRETVADAVETLTRATGLNADALFGSRVIDDLGSLPGPAAHAAGLIEGAALACDLTALELLDLLFSER